MAVDDGTLQALDDSLTVARRYLYQNLLPRRTIIGNLYSGRSSSGIMPDQTALMNFPTQAIPELNMEGSVALGTANLIFPTIQTISSATFPATPSVHATPLVDQAVGLEEDQERLSDFMFLNAGLDKAMEEAVPIILNNGWCGLKAITKSTGPAHERVQIVAIDALNVGWEPFLRRYSWHRYVVQASEVPKGWWPDHAEPWSLLSVTEVYIKEFGAVKMRLLWFIDSYDRKPVEGMDEAAVTALSDFGKFVHDQAIKGIPLIIPKFDDPPPGEDIPPSETIQWVPRAEAINDLLSKLEKEAREFQTVYLAAEDRLDKKEVRRVFDSDWSFTKHVLYVKSAEDSGMMGVSPSSVDSVVRPVEQQTVFQELLQAVQFEINLFFMQTGISELQRGIVPTGRQSATEIEVVNQNSQLRNARRRERLVDSLNEIAKYLVGEQKRIYGESIIIPSGNGVARSIPIPDPTAARMALRFDAVELGHLARQADIASTLQGHQIILNTRQAFPSGAPADVRQSMRLVLRSLGWKDVNTFVPPASGSETPEDRLQEFLIAPDQGLPVFPEDPHEVFIAFYDRWLKRQLGKPSSHRNQEVELQVSLAIEEHRSFAAANAPTGAQALGGTPGANAAAATAANAASAVGPEFIPNL